jgi:hypothetical protein
MYSKVPQMPSAAIYTFKFVGGRPPNHPSYAVSHHLLQILDPPLVCASARASVCVCVREVAHLSPIYTYMSYISTCIYKCVKFNLPASIPHSSNTTNNFILLESLIYSGVHEYMQGKSQYIFVYSGLVYT